MSSQSAPFNDAMKEIGKVMYADNNVISELKQQSLNISLGMLTFQSKIPRQKRDLFEIHMAMRDITKSVSEIESLELVWKRNQYILLNALLNA